MLSPVFLTLSLLLFTGSHYWRCPPTSLSSVNVFITLTHHFQGLSCHPHLLRHEFRPRWSFDPACCAYQWGSWTTYVWVGIRGCCCTGNCTGEVRRQPDSGILHTGWLVVVLALCENVSYPTSVSGVTQNLYSPFTTIAVSFHFSHQVKPVSYLMVNLDTVLWTRGGPLAAVPMGITLQFSVTYHDDVGDTFHSTNVQIGFRSSRWGWPRCPLIQRFCCSRDVLYGLHFIHVHTPTHIYIYISSLIYQCWYVL